MVDCRHGGWWIRGPGFGLGGGSIPLDWAMKAWKLLIAMVGESRGVKEKEGS